MNETVSQRIAFLQQRLQEVSNQLMAEDDKAAANGLEAHIRSLRLAIAHYQAALDIEQALR